jgi:hypothetical protein
MPRAILHLQEAADLRAVQGQWRFAPGFIPGAPNAGLVSQASGSPARLPDYDDAGWEVCHDLTAWHSHGLTFACYRLTLRLPEMGQGRAMQGARLLFETCIDDYGEIWINGAVIASTAPCRALTCRSGCSSLANPPRGSDTLLPCERSTARSASPVALFLSGMPCWPASGAPRVVARAAPRYCGVPNGCWTILATIGSAGWPKGGYSPGGIHVLWLSTWIWFSLSSTMPVDQHYELHAAGYWGLIHRATAWYTPQTTAWISVPADVDG